MDYIWISELMAFIVFIQASSQSSGFHMLFRARSPCEAQGGGYGMVKRKQRHTHHSKSASVQSQGPDVIDTEYVFPITHLDVGFSFR